MTLSSDQAWKVFTTLLAVLVVPLAGWVWSMNVEVAQLRNDLGDLEGIVADIDRQVEEQEEASRTLIGVEKDVEHIREILDRIEILVTR
jgi:cell division protein FtsL